MYSKIVDTVAVTSRTKPLGGGRVETWWEENSIGKHGLDKTTKNRRRINPGASFIMKKSVSETLTTFQFKGFEFGNWLNQADRYDVFRAFQHCSYVLSSFLKSNNIGFDYNIGVAFGARGHSKALAHYEPSTNIINMTKEKGAGSLLHEYAHALDYCIGSFFDQNANYAALSGGRTMTQQNNNVGGQFRYMINKILLYVRTTESFQKLKKVTDNSDYWCNSTELFARLTEAYFAYFYNDKYKDHYLVKRTSVYESQSAIGFYLSKKELSVIKPELDYFFKEVGKLLNGKCILKAYPFPKTMKEEPKKKESSREKTTSKKNTSANPKK